MSKCWLMKFCCLNYYTPTVKNLDNMFLGLTVFLDLCLRKLEIYILYANNCIAIMMLHLLIEQKKLDIDKVDDLSDNALKEICKECSISINRRSRVSVVFR